MITCNEYDKLIEAAQARNWSRTTAPEPVECHHIQPRCTFPDGTCNKVINDPSNLVYLTCAEHYTAHKLLAQANPDHVGLVTAYMILGDDPEARLLYKEVRASNYDKIYTDKFRDKISKSVTDLWKDPEYRNNRKHSGEAISGYWNTGDNKDKQSKRLTEAWARNPEAFLASRYTDEYRRKQSETSIAQWNKPGYRERAKAKALAHANRPEYMEERKVIARNRSKWIYHTPAGTFYTVPDAAEANNISKSCAESRFISKSNTEYTRVKR